MLFHANKLSRPCTPYIIFKLQLSLTYEVVVVFLDDFGGVAQDASDCFYRDSFQKKLSCQRVAKFVRIAFDLGVCKNKRKASPPASNGTRQF